MQSFPYVTDYINDIFDREKARLDYKLIRPLLTIPFFFLRIVLAFCLPYSPNTEKDIFVLEARKNKKYAPLTIATTAIVKGQYKLMYFFGYDELDGGERVELYDIGADPEEMTDLYSTKRETADAMLHELKTKLQEVNSVYK